MSESLFSKYGGVGTVSVIVQNFYDDVLEHPELKPFFEKVSMERLIDHQVKFLSHALGGPANYTGRSLRMAHRGLNIDPRVFGLVAEILESVLQDAGMSPEDIQSVMDIVSGTRDEIVGATT
jgi:hemoglobin